MHVRPSVQSTHAVWPSAPWNLPAVHKVQVPVPLLAAYEPGRHILQTAGSELPGIGFALPGEHARHATLLLAPVAGLYVPTGHCSKVWLAVAAPTVAQKPPDGHGLQLLDPGSALYVPASHAMHAEAPGFGLCAPGKHGKQRMEPLKFE